jgi:hypothetical protein
MPSSQPSVIPSQTPSEYSFIISSPKLLYAYFSDDGLFLYVIFDTPTDRGLRYASFSCDLLFMFSSVANSYCFWTSNVEVKIRFTKSVALNIGDVLSLNANTVKALCPMNYDCSYFMYAAPQSVNILAPAYPTLPDVVIVGPSVVGECVDPSLDITSSTGSSGRNWKSVHFTVSSGEADTSSIEYFLNNFYKLYPPTAIPRNLLNNSAHYQVNITLCNFLDACGSNVFRFQTLAVSIPTVSIRAPKTIARSQSLRVHATGTQYICSDDGKSTIPIASGLVYYWKIFDSAGHQLTSPAYKSISAYQNEYMLPSRTLSVNTEYKFEITVKNTVTGGSKLARHHLIYLLRNRSL